MNDLLFRREKRIKDELFLWFCLGFLINICYIKLDSPLNACSYLSWWRTKLSLVLWKRCVLYFCYIYIYAISVKSAINWNHSAFFCIWNKARLQFCGPGSRWNAVCLPQAFAICKLQLSWQHLKIWQDAAIWNTTHVLECIFTPYIHSNMNMMHLK